MTEHTDAEVWSCTDSNPTLWHAFDESGRALCNRRIRPRAGERAFFTRQQVENFPAAAPHDRCAVKLAERAEAERLAGSSMVAAAADQVAATVEAIDAEREQQAQPTVKTYYYPRTNGRAWGRQSREYCEGVVDLAIQHGLARTEMVKVTVTRAPGDEQATVVERVVRSSAPTGEPAEKGSTVAERQRAALARTHQRAAADRAARRREMDELGAAQRAQFGGEQHVVEGVVVEHNGTAEGSTPSDATHPDVVAIRAALKPLKPATLTDHHDPEEPDEDGRDVRGYMADPRGHGRVAVYWLEGGKVVRRDEPWHGPSLDCLAEKLRGAGWHVEGMFRSSKCVFTWRPGSRERLS